MLPAASYVSVNGCDTGFHFVRIMSNAPLPQAEAMNAHIMQNSNISQIDDEELVPQAPATARVRRLKSNSPNEPQNPQSTVHQARLYLIRRV